MRTSIATLAAALAFAGSAHAADSRVDAFRQACVVARDSFEQNRVHITQIGWRSIAEGDDPRIASVMQVVRKMVPDLVANGKDAYFTKIDGDHNLFIVLDLVHLKAVDALGCYVYDFDAAAAPDGAAFQEWLGEPPTQVSNQPGDITAQIWKQPQRVPKAGAIRFAYIEKGGPSANFAGFAGVVFAISSSLPKTS